MSLLIWSILMMRDNEKTPCVVGHSCHSTPTNVVTDPTPVDYSNHQEIVVVVVIMLAVSAVILLGLLGRLVYVQKFKFYTQRNIEFTQFHNAEQELQMSS